MRLRVVVAVAEGCGIGLCLLRLRAWPTSTTAEGCGGCGCCVGMGGRGVGLGERGPRTRQTPPARTSRQRRCQRRHAPRHLQGARPSYWHGYNAYHAGYKETMGPPRRGTEGSRPRSRHCRSSRRRSHMPESRHTGKRRQTARSKNESTGERRTANEPNGAASAGTHTPPSKPGPGATSNDSAAVAGPLPPPYKWGSEPTGGGSRTGQNTSGAGSDGRGGSGDGPDGSDGSESPAPARIQWEADAGRRS